MSTDTVETPTAPAVETAANTQIAVREPVALGSHGIKLTTLDELWRFAKIVATTDFVPKDFRGKPESTMIAIQYGMEVALTPMMALQTIGVINGKPGLHTDGPLAVVRGSGLLKEISEGLVVRTGDNLACSCVRWARDGECIHVRAATVKFANPAEERVAVCLVHRRGAADPHIQTFGVVDAKQARLWMRTGREGQSTPWVTHPDTMLKFKARGFALRDEFGDILKGLRSREELEEFGLDDLPPNGSDDDTSSTPPAKNRVDAMKERLAAAQGRPVDGHAAADDALDSAARSAALGSDPEPDAIEAEEEKPEPEPATEPEQPKGRKRAARPETPQPEKPAEDATIGRIAIGRLVDLTEKWTPADLADFYAEFGVESFEQLRSSVYNEAIGYVDARNGNDAPGVEGPGMFDADPATISIATDVDAAGLDETARERFKSWLPHWIESFEAVPVADVEKSKLLLVIFQLCRATDSDINKALTVYRDASCIAELTIEQLRTVQASLEKKAANLAAAGGE